jgi:hypothetical protein
VQLHGSPKGCGVYRCGITRALREREAQQRAEQKPAPQEPEAQLGALDAAIQFQVSKTLAEMGALRERALWERTELNNAVARGELLPASEVFIHGSRCFGGFRDSLLAIPGELQDRLAHETDPAVIRTILTERLYLALRFIEEFRDAYKPGAVADDAAA